MNKKRNDSSGNKKAIRCFDIDKTVQPFANRLLIANRTEANIKSYTRAIKRLHTFHQCDLYQLKINQIINFLS